ncbi:hypothetical protein ACSL103130_00050 [Actinomyces slackii]|uniref:Cell division protein FtsL n=1 Tax=Actinomyces slackii TaxID=52774 RepID=A0A448KF72_9ACTO|nr:hypothetical protein [Actinomyces slackii]VEG75540.1 Uncharacterised protein [Actinomyces slackii]
MSATATARVQGRRFASQPSAVEGRAQGASPASAGRAQDSARPALRVIRSAAPSRSTLPFLAIIILILSGALVASMLLNAQMADTAYQMKDKQIELNVMNDHVETLRTQVQEASAPDSLASRAEELGMVPAGAPGVVDLESSSLSGGAPAEAEKQR